MGGSIIAPFTEGPATDIIFLVERLESAMDEVNAENPPDEGQLPSADTLASDFQRFLRQRGPEG